LAFAGPHATTGASRQAGSGRGALWGGEKRRAEAAGARGQAQPLDGDVDQSVSDRQPAASVRPKAGGHQSRPSAASGMTGGSGTGIKLDVCESIEKYIAQQSPAPSGVATQ